jgi:hypothetical protein
MQWAVSQAVPFRRMHVQGDIVLHQNGGWASGGWMSDTLIDGNVAAGPQQQWISRNSEWRSWTGANWNMVFVGVLNPPEGEWPKPPYTTIAHTPIIREKPFLQVDSSGNYTVRVPSLSTNSSGITWHAASTPGKTIPIREFYIALPNRDNTATINAQLAKGKNLLFTPGIYELTEAIRVTRPNTVVMGVGFATLHPVNGTAAMTTSDTDGIIIAGLLFDAGSESSPVLLQIGPKSINRQPRKKSHLAPRRFLPCRRRRGRPRRNQSRNQQQQHHRRPHLDLARRSRRWRRLDQQHQPERPRRQRQQRHHLRSLRRTPPEIPGALER